jgi:N-acyl-D-amino-acid deacylase
LIQIGLSKIIKYEDCCGVLKYFYTGLIICFTWLNPDACAADTLIRQATVIDGSGARGYVADVRIAGDRIVDIRSQLNPAPDDILIDAGNLLLSPGFIDTHSHHDYGAAQHPQMLAAVSQGITMIVVGVDEGSTVPLEDYFAQLERAPVAVNVASYSGHNTLRAKVMGDDFRRPANSAELAEMRRLLAADLESGALGLSTGLEYDPGIYSQTSEVIVLARLAGECGGRYDSHLRSEDRFFWEALEELLIIGEAAEIPVHIAHIKLAANSLWGRAIAVRQQLIMSACSTEATWQLGRSQTWCFSIRSRLPITPPLQMLHVRLMALPQSG